MHISLKHAAAKARPLNGVSSVPRSRFTPRSDLGESQCKFVFRQPQRANLRKKVSYIPESDDARAVCCRPTLYIYAISYNYSYSCIYIQRLLLLVATTCSSKPALFIYSCHTVLSVLLFRAPPPLPRFSFSTSLPLRVSASFFFLFLSKIRRLLHTRRLVESHYTGHTHTQQLLVATTFSAASPRSRSIYSRLTVTVPFSQLPPLPRFIASHFAFWPRRPH